MKHLKFVLLLAIAANFWECGDAKFGEKGELSPRRRRCYDGSLPKRLKKKERKLSLEGSGGGEVCHRLYPRVSCCPSRRAPYQILHRKDARIFSTNNTECSRLLEEIKCAHCSPHAQMLFHSPKVEKAPHREQDLPRLCHDYCQEFYYTCRGHVPGQYNKTRAYCGGAETVVEATQYWHGKDMENHGNSKVWELHKDSDLSATIDNNSWTLTAHTSRPKITTAVCVWVACQCEWRWWWWGYPITSVVGAVASLPHAAPFLKRHGGLAGDERKERKLFQADVDEFCQYYGRKDGGLKHKHNCYCTQEILSGLRQPIGVVHCGDGSQRLFILEKEGFVRVLTHDMELLKEPFLDIHKLVQSGIKGGDERGLLSLAFHPNYKKNGKLYVSYTTNQERWAIGPHDHILRVVEYTVSRKNPNQVDTRTTRVLMEVAELHRKHLGGQLLFGPDGLLHIFLGDGMITLDDMEEMDGLSDFTGSVLRVDVDTDCCSTPYSIPKNNPYFNSTNQPPEIFAHGLHDPGRCAVDKLRMDTNGSLLILCTDTVGKNTTTGRILQVIKGKDYENEPSMFDLGSNEGAVPVGGFIYRGCQSRRLYGSYVFGDKNGNFRILQRPSEDRSWQEKPLCLGTSSSCGSSLVGHILGFGEDELGEVYILASSKSTAIQSHNGKLYKLVDPKRTYTPVFNRGNAFSENPECAHMHLRLNRIYPIDIHVHEFTARDSTHVNGVACHNNTKNPKVWMRDKGDLIWVLKVVEGSMGTAPPLDPPAHPATIPLPQVPKECRRPVEDPEMLSTACSRECKNGHCTPTGKCCCSSGWEGPFCLRAKCEPACRNGGVCVEPNKCLCKEGFSGSQCEKGERGTRGDGEKDSILEHIIDMTSYLLDLTSYIV
ncbi:Hedgehog-interacting protein [Labeo rohita]|uniref:Hedgehog-interacting protein n=1 Tax=Labeo rohita TaxID=84645 RepID=A0ABQ8MZY8_LABRO|nr:Hedgehog-interacting protein [Labeo rohita]